MRHFYTYIDEKPNVLGLTGLFKNLFLFFGVMLLMSVLMCAKSAEKIGMTTALFFILIIFLVLGFFISLLFVLFKQKGAKGIVRMLNISLDRKKRIKVDFYSLFDKKVKNEY